MRLVLDFVDADLHQTSLVSLFKYGQLAYPVRGEGQSKARNQEKNIIEGK